MEASLPFSDQMHLSDHLPHCQSYLFFIVAISHHQQPGKRKISSNGQTKSKLSQAKRGKPYHFLLMHVFFL